MIRDIREDVSASITVVPANEASWEDLQQIFGMRGYTAACQCQRFKVGPAGWTPMPVHERPHDVYHSTLDQGPPAVQSRGVKAVLWGLA